MELDFTMDFEVLGKIDTIELKEGGAEIPVTEENKEEYIRYRWHIDSVILKENRHINGCGTYLFFVNAT